MEGNPFRWGERSEHSNPLYVHHPIKVRADWIALREVCFKVYTLNLNMEDSSFTDTWVDVDSDTESEDTKVINEQPSAVRGRTVGMVSIMIIIPAIIAVLSATFRSPTASQPQLLSNGDTSVSRSGNIQIGHDFTRVLPSIPSLKIGEFLGNEGRSDHSLVELATSVSQQKSTASASNDRKQLTANLSAFSFASLFVAFQMLMSSSLILFLDFLHLFRWILCRLVIRRIVIFLQAQLD